MSEQIDFTQYYTELLGSERQVAWASDLRDRFVADALAAKEEFVRREELELRGGHDPERYAKWCDAYDQAIIEVIRGGGGGRNASTWIDYRRYSALDRVSRRIFWPEEE